jgi:hypothetical protein
MADTTGTAPPPPTTTEGFLADRLHFWHSATKFMTNVIIALVVLLLFLWWWLV